MEKECDIFCCYRGANSNTATGGAYGLSEFLAKEFAKYIEKKNNEITDPNVKKLKCHFSKDKRDGNYWGDIKPLISTAKYFLIFEFDGFTEGFLDEEDKLNESCVTAKEFIEAEKARQNGRLTIMSVNIAGREFSAKDQETIKELFVQSNCYWQEDNSEDKSAKENSVTKFVHTSHNDYHIGGDGKEVLFEKIRKAIEIKLGDGYEYSTAGDGICLQKYCGEDIEVTTPKYINSKPVVAFAPGTFAGNDKIQKITLSVGIRKIEEFSFKGCNSLEELLVPVTVETSNINDLKGTNIKINIERQGYKNIIINKNFDYVVHYDEIDNTHYAYLTKCKCATKNIDIPENIDGYEVVYFANIFDNLEQCREIQEIKLPRTIKSFDINAFRFLSNLSNISIHRANKTWYDQNNCLIARNSESLVVGTTTSVIPYQVEHIANRAFYNKAVENIKFISKSKLVSIGDCAFYNCRNIASMEIPRSVISIGSSAFYNCRNIASIEIPSSVTSIGYSAFSFCSSVTSIKIPSGVTRIGDYAFSYCSGITSIEVPSSVTSIGNGAFSFCSSITSIKVPSGVTSIGSDAFSYCSSVTSIEIPDSVTNIGDYIFHRCIRLIGVEIPIGITSIGNGAFYYCSSITSIDIPSSVTSIGDYVFYNCISLKSIYLPNSVTSIGDYVFYKCSSLTSIEIPSRVTSIGDYVFYKCSSLTSIEIQSGVKRIGDYAFSYCSGITSIEVPSSITSIGSGVFSFCSSLTNIKVPKSVKSISDEAFLGCSGLQSIEMSSSITSIGNSAFLNCSGLTNIEIPSSIISIGNYAFGGCSSLTNIDIPNSVTSIGDGLFGGCSSLTNIDIPNSVTSIGNYAFYNCSSLKSIEIPSSVTSIGSSAFLNCSGLTNIEIPSCVTSIGSSAFYNRSSFTLYCEAESQPSGWDTNWNPDNLPVVWGYKKSKK